MRTAVITVAHEDGSGEQWPEVYKENDGTRRGLTAAVVDVEAWARGLIDYFNETITRSDEKRRKFVSVSVTDDGAQAVLQHDWHKTSLVTECHGGRYFDRMRCERCGITAKRHGVTFIKRDSKFRAKKYEVCRP